LHPPVAQIADAPSQTGLRYGNRIVQILTAQRPFIPSWISSITCEGTARIVEVIGATVTVARWPMALSRVRTTTGLSLSGGLDR